MKKILITGISGSLGSAIAKKLLHQNYFIIGVSKSKKNYKKFLSKVQTKYKKNLDYIECNFNNNSSVDMLIKKLNNKHHNINYFVNCAGVISRKNFLKEKIQDWEKILKINTLVPMQISQNLLKRPKRKLSGLKFIFLGSQMSRLNHPAASPIYSVSKAAIQPLIRYCTSNYAKYGWTFNNVSPGTIKSRMQKDIKKTKFIKMIKDIPSKKIGQPEDVANLIAFLINKQSNYINGSIINLNGGSYLD